MRVDIAQPDFPEITYIKGNPVDGCEITVFVPSLRGKTLSYEMRTSDKAEAISDADAAKIAALMKSFADKHRMSVDVSSK